MRIFHFTTEYVILFPATISDSEKSSVSLKTFSNYWMSTPF